MINFEKSGLLTSVGKSIMKVISNDRRSDETTRESTIKDEDKKYKGGEIRKQRKESTPITVKKGKGAQQMPNPAPPARSGGKKDSLEEKFQLEQSIAKVIGGPTGLLAALDVMVYDTEEKNPVGFRCHADGYFWRLDQLKSYLKRHQQITTEELKTAPLCHELLAEGARLEEILKAPEELTDEALDSWRMEMLRHIDLYVDKKEDDHEQ